MDYKEELRNKIPELRAIEGFPNGDEEDIIELSNPPFFTACPNPFVKDFIEENGQIYDEKAYNYKKLPYTEDIDTNKNDRLTNAHSYHTKSPLHAIEQYIDHYTEKGDLVLDCFTGSGMTGIAAQKKGRKAILCDLSPIATFLAYNYNNSISSSKFLTVIGKILDDVEDELGWMLLTKHDKNTTGRIRSILYSEDFICPVCSTEFNLWDYAVDKEEGKFNDPFKCKSCNAEIKKGDCERLLVDVYDPYLNESIKQVSTQPVEIVYVVGKTRYKKKPDQGDLELIEKINQLEIPYQFPTYRMPVGGETRRNDKNGLTHVHHYFTKRNLFFLSAINHRINNVEDTELRSKLKITLNSMILRSSKKAILAINNYFNGGGGYITTISGNMYIPSLFFEVEILEQFKTRAKKINEINKHNLSEKNVCISTQSSTDLSNIPSNSIDYIFVDPPFGENLMYSELNYLYEAWLKIETNNTSEAIINRHQNKELNDYNVLMARSFKNLFRVLKPNRWITIEYHNSKSAIWNGLQEALTKAGFVIAHTSVLKNKGGSFVINVSPNSVANDLIINAYKPSEKFLNNFVANAGQNVEIEFVEDLLSSLPIQPMLERTEKMLYSKMIAYYLQKGYQINYDARSFYEMLYQNFIEQDGYWFTSSQINSYADFKKKHSVEDIGKGKQESLLFFIVDERSALIWLESFLSTPKSFSDISTAYNKLSNIQGDEVPDLKVLLEENFVFDGSIYRKPSSNEEKLKAIDKRNRTLKREFESLLVEAKNSRTKMRKVRKEAIVYGFEEAYKSKRYDDILTIGNKLHKSIIENSQEISEFIEIAEIQAEGLA